MSVIRRLSREPFQASLAWGQQAETEIAKWLLHKGAIILPVYDVECNSGKGPRVFCKEAEYVAPDLFCWAKGKALWIEAKHKEVFTRYRIKDIWETGIDLRHYENYCKLRDIIGLSVWVFFLHKSKVPRPEDAKYLDCPAECPTGLFGREINDLRQNESHRSNKHAHGMVYWSHDYLKPPLATIEELTKALK
jgi:hypothetical protein